MKPLQRHALVWLTRQAWQECLAEPDETRDGAGQACLRQWAEHDWPLVVTQQPPESSMHRIALGLPAPAAFGRQRLRLGAAAGQVRRWGAFPLAQELGRGLHESTQPAWAALCAGLACRGLVVRVYGSHAWQHLTGLRYLREASDLDLLVACRSPGDADAACSLLDRDAAGLPRLDGELVFDDGRAVAWREWAAWREGRTRQMLVKRLHGATVEEPGSELAPA